MNLGGINMKNILSVEKIEKYYGNKGNITKAIDNISFKVGEGEFVGIMGPSGSGKTTLLNCISTIDTVTAGKIIINGNDITEIKDRDIASFRRNNLGFVFQDFNLLDNFNNRDNIFLPLVLSKKKYPEMKERLKPIAKQLGIEGILDKFPYEISGGQKQRVAVARAIITNPDLILADEPTGALDSKSTEELLHLFGTINANQQTIVMVTHSTKAASHASRVLFIKDGKIFHEIYKGNKNLDQMYQCISDTLTLLATGGVHHE